MHHHPHSYSLDSLSQSQSLASLILSSSSPPQISSACASIDSFLHSHSPDHSRHFFSLAFPPLICKLFGFDDGPAPASSSSPSAPAPAAVHHGWVDTIISSNDPDLASRVFALLSPDGPLMSSISAVDRLGLVRYVFPTERLPEWTRYMLLNDRDIRVLADLCPLLRGKVREDSIKGSFFQVQLNVFEYFMFWFAYYPVCRGNSENLDVVASKKSKRSRLENWASSIPGISSVKRGIDHNKTECNLYIRLLYAYLRAFVPIDDLTAHQPYRSSLLHYPTDYDGSILAQAQFLVDTLINYWLVDNDFSPVSVNACKSIGVSFPFRSVLGETPPTSGLGEVVKLFVKYLNLSLAKDKEVNGSADCGRSPRWRSGDSPESRDVVVSGSHTDPVGSWNSRIQRPLYRYILRTFLFCPVETSMKNASQVFSVWMSYIEPWEISLDDFSELGGVGGLAKSERKGDSRSQVVGYSSAWQDYVLSNYLYYSSMVMHFIGFAHKFLHTDPEVIVQMVLKIMSILTSSKELIDLIRNVYTLFHTKEAGISKSSLKSLYQYIPSIREQLQDWEDGLCESDADGSFLHENWNKDLRLFGDGEDGGKHLLQLFILRAEAELQATSRDSLGQNLQLIDSLKDKIGQLFGGNFLEPVNLGQKVDEPHCSREEIFRPRRIGKRALANVKYRGDWMKRPVSDDEIAWLAKLLVQLSAWLNEAIGLDHAGESAEDGSKPSYVEVPTDEGSVCGPVDTARTLLWAVGSWLVVVSSALVRLMRKHGVRVNLRILASKKIVMVVLVSALFAVLRRALGSFRSV
ncbi:hypothetical protein CDL15_Pgr021506 [Punica granatum]|uniref:Sphingomyelin phosphodiesterase 4 n=1 Tax=Punica granatum TaxID=22663 RepID=A0A218XP18_PUNGR|nr:hypothetical protein CDL15_Pgr021506 [Punica granatum]